MLLVVIEGVQIAREHQQHGEGVVGNLDALHDLVVGKDDLVSQEVVEAAADTPVTFMEVGPVELRGVSDTLRLHAARRRN